MVKLHVVDYAMRSEQLLWQSCWIIATCLVELYTVA